MRLTIFIAVASRGSIRRYLYRSVLPRAPPGEAVRFEGL
jgi:hypothetical protein